MLSPPVGQKYISSTECKQNKQYITIRVSELNLANLMVEKKEEQPKETKEEGITMEQTGLISS